MSRQIVYFAHITDTHIGPDPGYERHGHFPYRCARRLVEILNNLPVQPDFVMHTGDVVYDPDPAAYRLAAEIFGQLQAPVYYVAGNHDRARDLHHFLPMGPKDDLSPDRDTLSYVFEVKGNRFLVVDARGPDEIDPHGLIGAGRLELIRQELTANGPPLTLFIHFPVLPLNSIWMDAHMLAIDGYKLHEALLPARERIRGIFYGHVHRSMQTLRDGLLYASGPSAFAQFLAWPDDIDVQFDPEAPPGYSFVHLLPGNTIIHEHTFPRPALEPYAIAD
jgi:3',5'-cyclic-AMP phosphodiesterase